MKAMPDIPYAVMIEGDAIALRGERLSRLTRADATRLMYALAGAIGKLAVPLEATWKFYRQGPGYGFATLDDGRDVFVHAITLRACSVWPPPKEGARVALTTVERPNGLAANWIGDPFTKRKETQP